MVACSLKRLSPSSVDFPSEMAVILFTPGMCHSSHSHFSPLREQLLTADADGVTASIRHSFINLNLRGVVRVPGLQNAIFYRQREMGHFLIKCAASGEQEFWLPRYGKQGANLICT